jgi:histone H1/5
MSSEQSNEPVAAEVDPAITAEAEEKKETKAESMEVETPAADAPSDDASVESSPAAAEKPKGKAKAPAKKKAAAAPKKAAAAAGPKRAAKKVAAAPAVAAAAPASPPKPAVAVASPKAKAPAAAKKPAAKESASGSHPPYLEMIVAAVESLKERSGSSRQAILKYITSNYSLGVDQKMANVHLKQALKRGISVGTLMNTKVSCCLLLEYFGAKLRASFLQLL